MKEYRKSMRGKQSEKKGRKEEKKNGWATKTTKRKKVEKNQHKRGAKVDEDVLPRNLFFFFELKTHRTHLCVRSVPMCGQDFYLACNAGDESNFSTRCFCSHVFFFFPLKTFFVQALCRNKMQNPK